jgi:trehalose-phosphatase
MPNEIKMQLQSLVNTDRCSVAVLSGRSLQDIKAKVGIGSICYGGNHGLEISGSELFYIHPGALLAKAEIDMAGRRLNNEIARIKGAWVERKQFSVSLHYRSVDKKDIQLVKSVFYRVKAELPETDSLCVMKGKKVLELLPDIMWDKGSAVHWILRRLEGAHLPIYVGDDVTDEYAFRALGKKGITIKVGTSKKTSAQYYLKTSREVQRLLQLILERIYR